MASTERVWLLELQEKEAKLENFAKSWPLVKGLPEGFPLGAEYAGRFERLDRALAIGMRPVIKKWCRKEAYLMRKHDEKAIFEGGPKAVWQAVSLPLSEGF